MQRTPCPYCSLPQATEEDDTKLHNRQMETSTYASDLELFGEPLCWHPFTGDHPNGGELIAALKLWRERAEAPKQPNPTIATALEHLQKAEAALKTALDNFRATALAAGKVMP